LGLVDNFRFGHKRTSYDDDLHPSFFDYKTGERYAEKDVKCWAYLPDMKAAVKFWEDNQ